PRRRGRARDVVARARLARARSVPRRRRARTGRERTGEPMTLPRARAAIFLALAAALAGCPSPPRKPETPIFDAEALSSEGSVIFRYRKGEVAPDDAKLAADDFEKVRAVVTQELELAN